MLFIVGFTKHENHKNLTSTSLAGNASLDPCLLTMPYMQCQGNCMGSRVVEEYLVEGLSSGQGVVERLCSRSFASILCRHHCVLLGIRS